MFPSILTFDFDLTLGSFLTFWGPNGLFLGLEKGLKTVLGSTHVVEQLLFSMFPLIMNFDFDLILGLFLNFFGSTHVAELSFSMFSSILFLTFLGSNGLFLV